MSVYCLLSTKSFHCMYLLFPLNHADFQVSLDLQWDYCSGQLTLICNHSNIQTDPLWAYNGTSDDGVALENIPGANYTESTPTRHVAVISGMENVMAVDSFSFQCVYRLLNNIRVRSNKAQYYWGKLTLNCVPCRVYLYHTSCKSCCKKCSMPHHVPVLSDCLSVFLHAMTVC